MRNTKQKELILKIINNSYNHPTALDIYKEAKKTIPNISLGTIYRNLKLLTEQNEIRMIKMKDNINRFDHINQKHSHFICLKCGKIMDVYEDYLNSKKTIDDNIVMDYEINFKGICKTCSKEKEIKYGIKRK